MTVLARARYWLPAAVLGFVVGLMGASVPRLIHFDSGGRKMESPTLPQLLKKIDKTQVGAMDAFAASLLARLRADPQVLVETAASQDQDGAMRARETLLRLEDTIIWPVTNARADIDVADRLWLTGAAVRAEIRLRRQLASTLEHLMADDTLLPQESPPGMTEGTPPPMRVCDQAYLQLRELVYATEGDYTGMLNRDRFLADPFQERDLELKKFLKDRRFTNFMDESAQDPGAREQ